MLRPRFVPRSRSSAGIVAAASAVGASSATPDPTVPSQQPASLERAMPWSAQSPLQALFHHIEMNTASGRRLADSDVCQLLAGVSKGARAPNSSAMDGSQSQDSFAELPIARALVERLLHAQHEVGQQTKNLLCSGSSYASAEAKEKFGDLVQLPTPAPKPSFSPPSLRARSSSSSSDTAMVAAALTPPAVLVALQSLTASTQGDDAARALGVQQVHSCVRDHVSELSFGGSDETATDSHEYLMNFTRSVYQQARRVGVEPDAAPSTSSLLGTEKWVNAIKKLYTDADMTLSFCDWFKLLLRCEADLRRPTSTDIVASSKHSTNSLVGIFDDATLAHFIALPEFLSAEEAWTRSLDHLLVSLDFLADPGLAIHACLEVGFYAATSPGNRKALTEIEKVGQLVAHLTEANSPHVPLRFTHRSLLCAVIEATRRIAYESMAEVAYQKDWVNTALNLVTTSVYLEIMLAVSSQDTTRFGQGEVASWFRLGAAAAAIEPAVDAGPQIASPELAALDLSSCSPNDLESAVRIVVVNAIESLPLANTKRALVGSFQKTIAPAELMMQWADNLLTGCSQLIHLKRPPSMPNPAEVNIPATNAMPTMSSSPAETTKGKELFQLSHKKVFPTSWKHLPKLWQQMCQLKVFKHLLERYASEAQYKALNEVPAEWRCGCGTLNHLFDLECDQCSNSSTSRWECKTCHHSNVSMEHACQHCGDLSPQNAALAASTPSQTSSSTQTKERRASSSPKTWLCRGCLLIHHGKRSECPSCHVANPVAKSHCNECHKESYHSDPCCRHCGSLNGTEAKPSTNPASLKLWHCTRCSTLNMGKLRPGSQEQVCRKCDTPCQPEHAASRMEYQRWRCGCGQLNSPLFQRCVQCSSSAFEGATAGSSSGPSSASSSTGSQGKARPKKKLQYQCPQCHKLSALTKGAQLNDYGKGAKKVKGSNSCEHCRHPHPHTLSMIRSRLVVCPHCTTLVHLRPKAVQQQGESKSDDTDVEGSCPSCCAHLRPIEALLPHYPDLPWKCHGCCESNSLSKTMGEGDSAVICGSCHRERLPPSRYQDYEPWMCTSCHVQNRGGSSCRSCWALHPGLQLDDVFVWRCGPHIKGASDRQQTCRLSHPSWTPTCQQCGMQREVAVAAGSVTERLQDTTHKDSKPSPFSHLSSQIIEQQHEGLQSSPTVAAVEEQVGIYRYEFWKCPSCTHRNSPFQLDACVGCRKPRSPARCMMCGDSHLSHKCPVSSRQTKLQDLEEALLKAAAQRRTPPSAPSTFTAENKEDAKLWTQGKGPGRASSPRSSQPVINPELLCRPINWQQAFKVLHSNPAEQS